MAARLVQIDDSNRSQGATEPLTTYQPEDDGPAGCYARLGFVPSGDRVDQVEPIVRLPIR